MIERLLKGRPGGDGVLGRVGLWRHWSLRVYAPVYGNKQWAAAAMTQVGQGPIYTSRWRALAILRACLWALRQPGHHFDLSNPNRVIHLADGDEMRP